MSRKWSDFLFAIAVRFFCGAVLGAIASILICAPLGRQAARRPLLIRVFGNKAHPDRPYYWIGAWSLLGGILAALTTPKWQRRWTKRDSIDIRRSVTIETVGEDGVHREYHSMDEVPPDVRMKIKELEAKAVREKGNELCITETSQTENEFTSTIIRKQNVSMFEVIDAARVKHVYHSLDEMPPEIRAAMLKADVKLE